jgi:hypothetical protein
MTQCLHMKFRQFNVILFEDQDVKEWKLKVFCRLYDQEFTLTLQDIQVYSLETMSSSVRISVFKFSPRICKHGRCNCSYSNKHSHSKV